MSMYLYACMIRLYALNDCIRQWLLLTLYLLNSGAYITQHLYYNILYAISASKVFKPLHVQVKDLYRTELEKNKNYCGAQNIEVEGAQNQKSQKKGLYQRIDQKQKKKLNKLLIKCIKELKVYYKNLNKQNVNKYQKLYKTKMNAHNYIHQINK